MVNLRLVAVPHCNNLQRLRFDLGSCSKLTAGSCLVLSCPFLPNLTNKGPMCHKGRKGLICLVLRSLLLVSLLLPWRTLAQDNVTRTAKAIVVLNQVAMSLDTPPQWNRLPLPQSQRFNDSLKIGLAITDWTAQLAAAGYLEAHADSSWMVSARAVETAKQDTMMVLWHLGPRYLWVSLRTHNIPESWLQELGGLNRWVGSVVTPSEVSQLQQQVVSLASNRGYPFAKTWLDSLEAVRQWGDNSARNTLGTRAVLSLNLGPAIRWDTMQVLGNLNVDASWLEGYLRMRPGTPYSTELAKQAQQSLTQLSWLNMQEPLQVNFRNRIAMPLLKADKRNSNQVDGIIGFLPNEVNPGQVLITGEVKLQLHNLFRTGKTLLLDWQSMKPESQRLNVRYEHPQLLGLPIEPMVHFQLLKEDSNFLNRNLRIQVAYRYANGAKLGVFLGLVNSSVLLRQPPADGGNQQATSDLTQYGISFQWPQLDHPLYPHRGYVLSAEASLGDKQLRAPVNATPAWRDSLSRAGLQYQFQLRAEHYTPLAPRWVWYNRLMGAALVNNTLVRNELFRIGGLQSFRGFNENHFFTSQYAVMTSELRLFVDATTFLSAFVDQGWLQQQVLSTTVTDLPTGLGLGLHFSAGAGVFSVQWAVGQERGLPFSIETSKLHVGVAARF